MIHSKEYYIEIESLMKSSLNELEYSLSSAELSDVKDYIENAEYGLAYDLLTHILNEKKIEFPKNLLLAAKRMGIQLTHSDLIDKDKSVTKGIGVSVGINTDSNTNDSGGISGVSLTYNDSKKEGVTRATIGEGTVTFAGVEDDKGINRDINKAQEVLVDEGMEVTVNVPIEFIKNPKKYSEESFQNVLTFPSRTIGEVKDVVNTAIEYSNKIVDMLPKNEQVTLEERNQLATSMAIVDALAKRQASGEEVGNVKISFNSYVDENGDAYGDEILIEDLELLYRTY